VLNLIEDISKAVKNQFAKDLRRHRSSDWTAEKTR